ncbi:hypothetical protein [Flavobacterium fluviatile]|uniref:hypothetical protein n=1 Tax=Flavobacterium fluviatile TaxID=1862387 RepID=UPI0013D7E36A|nr:hypothetical protein [Flavobacterium fluviatile]
MKIEANYINARRNYIKLFLTHLAILIIIKKIRNLAIGEGFSETDSNNIKENKNNSEGKTIEETTDPSKLSKL